jgi:HAD superfamily hydrolase (TIGR01450 family)
VARLQYDLRKYRAILFDVDGVLRRGSQPIPTVAETLSTLREKGVAVGVVTNNSGSGAEVISQYLAKVGADFQPHEVISAVDASAMWIAKQGAGKSAYVLGSNHVCDVLLQHGIQVIEAPETVDYRCDYLVVGACREIDYEMLTRALRVGLQGAVFLAINTDRMYPGTHGLYPAAGAIAGAVRGMLGRDADVSIGKPAPHLGLLALERFGVTADETLMVGDTLASDILMGRRLGMDTALVLTGNDGRADIDPTNEPTFVIESLADLVP